MCFFSERGITSIVREIKIRQSMTSFHAATTGILQSDLKRVIAYSTCSQLGYMIFACGISNYWVSVFHLMNHAFFQSITLPDCGFGDSCHVG
jgi:NADH:ubiquinone oxidoreductase subunit 5 (subunit L)/multisubunit Na+/H+ antiporter MnhA subunit